MKLSEVKEGQYFVVLNSKNPASLLRMGSDQQILEIAFREWSGVSARIIRIPGINPATTEVQLVVIKEEKKREMS